MKENIIEIQIKIKGIHSYYLNRIILLSLNKLKEWTLDKRIIQKQVYLPKKSKSFTLLRSPHVDKKARDQFEHVTYVRILVLKIVLTENTTLFLYRFIQYITSLNLGSRLEVYYKNIQRVSLTQSSSKLRKKG